MKIEAVTYIMTVIVGLACVSSGVGCLARA